MKRRSIWYTIAREVPYFGPKLKLLESCGYLPGWFVDNMHKCLISENESGCIWLSKC